MDMPYQAHPRIDRLSLAFIIIPIKVDLTKVRDAKLRVLASSENKQTVDTDDVMSAVKELNWKYHQAPVIQLPVLG